MRESIPERLLLRRELRLWDGLVEAVRISVRGNYHAESPPLAGHAIDLHLSGPLRTGKRVEGARAFEGVELPRHFGAVYPAGVPFAVHGVEPSEDLVVMLDAGFVRRVAADVGVDPDGFEVRHRFCFRDDRMERLAASFLPEIESGGLGGEVFAQGLATALAVHLLREHSSLGESAVRRVVSEPTGGLSPRQLAKALDFIGDNLSGDLSLEEIAAQANLSARHFTRLFKESTGLSPHRYVIEQRVERAKGLLAGTELPIHEVAMKCGFAHQSHLAYHVRRTLGATPAQVRRGSAG